MKKMLAVALAVMMLTLGACSNAPASTEAKEESNTAAAQSTEEQETEEKKPYLLLAVSFLNIRSYLLFLMRFLWDQNGESKRGEMTALP